MLKYYALLVAVTAAPLLASPLPPELQRPLSIVDAVGIAAKRNGTILQAQREIEAAYGVAIQTRAVALPTVAETARYRYNEDGLYEPGLIEPNNHDWSSSVQIVQSIYEGGRMVSAVRSSRLIRERALLNYQSVVSDIFLQVRTAYDDALYASKQIEVRAASVKLLSEQLDLTKKRAAAGVITEFEVLRGEVELSNAQPPLITARNDLATSKQRLVQLMGFDLPSDAPLDLPIKLSSSLSAVPYPGGLARAVEKAVTSRTELGSLRKEQSLRKEEIIAAKSGYKPRLQAFAGYDLLSKTNSSSASDYTSGWGVGGQLSWAIFDGQLTKGRVQEATALNDRAGEALAEATRRVALEVRINWSALDEAKAVLVSQQKNIDTAIESLRLAVTRYEAGTGTQIDVLSAQTALTDARVSYVQALRNYSVSRARLERAVGDDLRVGSR